METPVDPMNERLEAELIEVARSAIAEAIKDRDWHFDADKVQMLHYPELCNLRSDGRKEYLFVAGLPNYGGPAFCGLCVQSEGGDFEVFPVHRVEAGLKEIFISDVNDDGVPEIVTLWQEDFGLYLTLHITRWDGASARSLFPQERFHQGFMELKDLDADGADEVVIWTGRYENNPRWAPQYFDILVFGYDGDTYELRQTKRSDRPYLPSSMLGQKIGFTGLPIEFDRPVSASTQRRKLEQHIIANGEADPEFLEELGRQSSLLHEEGMHDEAAEMVDVVFEGIEHVADPKAKLIVSYEAWVARAIDCSWMGRWSETIEAYKEVVELYDGGASAHVPPQHGASRRRELAFAHYRVGDYENAIAWLLDAEALLQNTSMKKDDYKDELARIRSLAGMIRSETGEFHLAAPALREASRLHGELGRYKQAAISRTILGNALRDEARIRESDFGEAIRSYQDAIDDLNRMEYGTGDSKDRESDVYLELGRTFMLDDKPQVAISFLEKSLLLTGVSNLLHHGAEHYLYLGEAHAGLQRRGWAEKYLRKALDLSEEYGNLETHWRVLHGLARLQLDNGRKAEAESTLKSCVDTIERLRSQVLPESTKVSMLSPKERPYRDLITMLCKAEDGPSARIEAFEYLERAKSRVFTEQLSGTDLNTTGVPSDLLDEERRLLRELRAVRLGHEANERRKYDCNEGDQIEADLAGVRDRIVRSGKKGQEYVSLRQGSPLGFEEVRDVLNRFDEHLTRNNDRADSACTVLAEYFSTEETTFVFLLKGDSDRPEVFEIDVPQDLLWSWRRTVFEEVGGPSDWDLEEWQADLGCLVEPLIHYSSEDDVIWFVPHGDLHRLPLHALKLDGRYLIERNAVFYSPSASVMPYCETKGTGKLENALVVGDPLDDLPAALEEAQAVAAMFEVDPILKREATKPFVVYRLGSSDGSIDVLHFACHGEFDQFRPLESRLKLAAESWQKRHAGGVKYEKLTAGEILKSEIRAELVTLSACESGLSERRPGDELIGLANSFVLAGASSVIVSLWRVNDRSTKLLMENFYRTLLNSLDANKKTGVSKAEALRAAQRNVIASEKFAHPYFWGPFVLLGDWR